MTTIDFFPQRLTWVRLKRGLNKSELANMLKVDLRTVSAYESGEFHPSSARQQELCGLFGLSANYFGLGPMNGPEPEQISFRALSKLSASKRDMARANAAFAFSICDWLEKSFSFPSVNVPDLRESSDPEDAAFRLRQIWGLGEKPVSNMIHLLESKGVRIFSLFVPAKEVDAFCTWEAERPFVFLNTFKSAARSRFDAAHELGHLVMHRHGNYDGRLTEKEADQFASAFLMPRSGFSSTAPRVPNVKNIVECKKKWGVSVSAYIMRLRSSGLISDWQYRSLFKQISQRGYRTAEPNDYRREQSKLLEMLMSELRKDGVGVAGIADAIGISPNDVSDLLFRLTISPIMGSGTGNPKGSGDHLSVVADNTKFN